MKKLFAAAIVALPLLSLSAGYADAPVSGQMKAFVVEMKNDKELLKAASDVEPEEVVEYQLTYTNKGVANISGLTVVGPVPAGTAYLSDSASADVAATLKVSIDGGKTFVKEPVTKTVVKSNGEVIESIVPPDQYTHLQWKASEAISSDGGKQFYRYRVRVK